MISKRIFGILIYPSSEIIIDDIGSAILTKRAFNVTINLTEIKLFYYHFA